jgi:acetylornithine/LysW-gamma-L-lysine aminotransferase
LIVGIELRSKVAPVIRALQERGVLALNAGITVLRLLPPLVIDKDALEQVAQAIEQVLADMPELSHKQTGES